MSAPRYEWRNLTPEQRRDLLAWRRRERRPWHSPPHSPNFGRLQFHITAACHEHQPHIGRSHERMESFASELLAVLSSGSGRIFAWCVLPNHYHALVEAPDVTALLHALGRFHGRTSHAWNGEERTRGRQVFFCAAERAMRSDAHYFATLNYIHHNAVHHGYVARWTEWPWSSAAQYLEQAGDVEAERIWRKYPVRDYGNGWDEPEM